MQTYSEFTEDNQCVDCSCCKKCNKFKAGDRIELSIIGVLYLGQRTVNRGTVEGQLKNGRRRVVILVHWDGYPATLIGKVNPTYIQKLNVASIAFL
jgi:hypothetical protein